MHHNYLEKACQEIDAAIFSGDALQFLHNREDLTSFCNRWLNAIQDFERDPATTKPEPTEALDPGAVYYACDSLIAEMKKDQHTHDKLAELVDGGDNLVRICMAIATAWETWACAHIFFVEMKDVWGYLVHEKFGGAMFDTLPADELLSHMHRQPPVKLDMAFTIVASRMGLKLKIL